MDLDKILSGQGITVKNPQYTGKRDKKHPPTIEIPRTVNNEGSIYRDFNDSSPEYGWMFNQVENPEKYRERGVYINRHNLDRLDKELYERQSSFEVLLNGLAQTANEIVLGSAAATAELPTAVPVALAQFTDFLLGKVFGAYDGNQIQKFFGVDDAEYGNAISNKLNEWKESIDNATPIYMDPDADNIANGGLGHLSWYMKNFPSLASSLTLLLPTKLASGATSAALKGIKSLSNTRKLNKVLKEAENIQNFKAAGEAIKGAEETIKLNKLQSFIHSPIRQRQLKTAGSITGEALIMRTLENYQEAHQTYTDLYKQSLEQFDKMSQADYNDFINKNKEGLDRDEVDKNNKDAVAKWVAKKGADRTFALDYSNIVFDILQLTGLKNIGLISKDIKSPRLTRLHRESIEQAALSPEKIAAKEAAKTSRQKLLEYAKDNIKGAWPKFWKESTEGIEEAVNYIASEEGITYGNVLLGNESDSSLGGFFNKRLANYMSSPELWESAFWGWLGGLTFGAVGTGVEQYQTYRKEANRRKEQRAKIRKLKEEAGIPIDEEEEKKESQRDDWVEMSELSDIKGAAAGIRKRNVRLQTLSNDLKAVGDGKNPFDVKDGVMREIDAINKEQQQALLKAKLIHRFRRELAKDAINSGTYDSLTDYLASEPVRQALVEMGAVSEEDSRAFIDQTLKDLEETRSIMSKNLADVNYKISVLNKSAGPNNQIPLEYVQHIANANTDREMDIADINEQLQILENMLVEAEKDGGIKETLGDSATVRQTMKLSQIVHTWSQLEAKRKAIEADPDMIEWRRAQDLDHIKEQKDVLLNVLKDTYQVGDNDTQRNVNTLGAMLYMVRSSKIYKNLGGNQYTLDENAEEAKKTDEELIAEFEDMFGKNKSADEITSIGQAEKLVHQAMTSLNGMTDASGNSINSLRNKNAKAYDLHAQIADLELLRTTYDSMIARSQKQISEAVDVLHNTFSHVREEVLIKAEKTLRDIHNKYLETNQADVEKAIVQAFFGNRDQADEIAKRVLTGTDEDGKSDATKFMTALNMIALSQGASRGAFKYVMQVLAMNTERARASRENNTNSQNPPQSNQNPQPNNISQQGQQSNGGAGNGQNLNPPTNNQPQQAQQQGGQAPVQPSAQNNNNGFACIVFNNDGTISSIRRNKTNKGNGLNVPIKSVDPNGVGELDVDSLNDVDKARLVASDELFDQNGVILTMPDASYSINSNPFITRAGKVLVKGKLVDNNAPTTQGGGQPAQQPAQQPPTNPPAPQAQGPTQPQTQGAPNTNGPIVTQGPNGEQFVQANLATGEVEGFDDIQDENKSDLAVIVNERVIDELFGRYDCFDDPIKFAQIDINTLKEQLFNDVKSIAEQEGIPVTNDDEIKNSIDRHIKYYATQIAISNSALKDGRYLAASVVKLAMYSKAENRNSFSQTILDASIKEVLDNYVKCLIIPPVNGVYIIDPTDILNVLRAAERNNSSDLVTATYHALKAYFDTFEGKTKYQLAVPMDDSLLQRVNSGATIIEQKDVLQPTQRERINIYDFLEGIKENWNSPDPVKRNEARQKKAIFDNIHTGDVVDIVYNQQYGGYDLFANGVQIGFIPQPGYNSTDNSYSMINQHWLTNVRLDSRGNPISPLLDLFKQWFTGTNQVDVQIQQLLVDAYLADLKGDYSTFRQTVANIFQNPQNPVGAAIQALVGTRTGNNQGKLIFPDKSNNPIDYAVVFDHLYNLWHYTVLTAQQQKIQGLQSDIRKMLEQWFKNRYRTYDRITNANITKNQIEIDYINEGHLIKVSASPFADYDKLPLSSEALANPSQARVGYIDGNNIVHTSDHDGTFGTVEKNTSGLNPYTALVALHSRNGTTDYAVAIGLRTSDPEFKNLQNNSIIGKAITRNGVLLIRALETAIRDGRLSDALKLKVRDYLESIVRSDTNNANSDIIPIFGNINSTKYGIKITENKGKNGGVIGYQIQVELKGGRGQQNQGIIKSFGINWASYDETSNIVSLAEYDGSTKNYKFHYRKRGSSYNPAESVGDMLVTYLKDYIGITVSHNAINSDSAPTETNAGFIKRVKDQTGKIKTVLEAPELDGSPSESATFDSYSSMLIECNMLRVNTKKGPTDSNYEVTQDSPGNNSQRGNQVMYVDLGSVQDAVEVSKDIQYENDETDTIAAQKQALKDSIESYTATIKANAEAVNQQAKSDFYKALFANAKRTPVLDNLLRLIEEYQLEVDILPDKILYDKEFNSYNRATKTEVANIAATAQGNVDRTYAVVKPNGRQSSRRLKQGWTVVGNKFLNMLASDNVGRRNTAIKTLFHEKIHNILNDESLVDRETLLKEIANVYDIFERAFEAQYDSANPNHDYIKKIIDRYKHSEPDRKLEEFLVEAMTDRSFYDFLNSIQIQEKVESTEKKTLLDKIVDIIRRLFNWKPITENSLYHKLYETLKTYNDTTSASTQQTTTTQQEEESTQATSPVEKNDDTQQQPRRRRERRSSDDTVLSAVENLNPVEIPASIDAEGRAVTSIDVVRNQLPIDCQSNFDSLVDSGWCNITCK